MTIDDLIERIMDNDLFELELIQTDIIDLLMKQLVGNQLVSPHSTQSNDISLNLIIGVNFLRQVCLKNCIILQMSPLFTL